MSFAMHYDIAGKKYVLAYKNSIIDILKEASKNEYIYFTKDSISDVLVFTDSNDANKYHYKRIIDLMNMICNEKKLPFTININDLCYIKKKYINIVDRKVIFLKKYKTIFLE